MGHHHIPIRMATGEKKPDTTKRWRGSEPQEAGALLVGMQNGTATVCDRLTVSYKAKHSFTV